MPFKTNSTNVEIDWFSWEPIHITTTLFLLLIFSLSIILTLQFIVKYRKYRIAEDLDSTSDISGIKIIILFIYYYLFFELFLK